MSSRPTCAGAVARRTSALLFDLDGTLTDPRPGIVGCIRYALEGLGAPCPSDEALARFIGPPLRGTFAALLATTRTSVIEHAVRLYRERFTDVGVFENTVYDGVPAMLRRLQGPGATLYVATSKPRPYAERIVEHFAIDGHFAAVYGPDLDGRLDDKAELLAHLLGQEALSAEGTVMIGDRAVDMIAARSNCLRAVGVLWGYGTRDELLDAGADALCDEPGDLAAVLSGMVA